MSSDLFEERREIFITSINPQIKNIDPRYFNCLCLNDIYLQIEIPSTIKGLCFQNNINVTEINIPPHIEYLSLIGLCISLNNILIL